MRGIEREQAARPDDGSIRINPKVFPLRSQDDLQTLEDQLKTAEFYGAMVIIFYNICVILDAFIHHN